MTLRDVMRGWALTHRDRAIENVEAARHMHDALRSGPGVSVGRIRQAKARLDRAWIGLSFWEDLYGRLSPANGGHLPKGRP